MTAAPEIRIHDTPDELASAVAGRLVSRLVDVQAAGRIPSIVLTGGSIAVRVHEAVAASPDRDLVDWALVDFWFGDERYVPADSPDRNVGQAARAMLDQLLVDPSRVRAIPASDGEYGEDVDAAAAAYADLLSSSASSGDPLFDVLMLGIGPDGHCASLFPGRPEMYDERLAVSVRVSPKPPPTRITMTLATLSRADQVWWLAAGAEKAQAVHDALSGADPALVPAAGPKGISRTLWITDQAAASKLARP